MNNKVAPVKLPPTKSEQVSKGKKDSIVHPQVEKSTYIKLPPISTDRKTSPGDSSLDLQEQIKTHESVFSSHHQKAISIKISEFLHPDTPTISQENLIQREDDSSGSNKSPTPSNNSLLDKEVESLVLTNPTVSKENPLQRDDIKTNPLVNSSLSDEDSLHPKNIRTIGLTNPSFSIENASDTSNSNRSSPHIFTFEDTEIKDYQNENKHCLTADTGKIRKNSASFIQVERFGRRSLDTGGQLRVPSHSELRRPSETSYLNKDINIPSQLTLSGNNEVPLGTPYTNGKLDLQPPPSPGLLSINSAWSELAKLHSRRSSYTDQSETRTNSPSLSNVSSSLSQYLHDLVRAFSSRTEKNKESTIQPPTPSSLSEVDAVSEANSVISNVDKDLQKKINSFYPDTDTLPTEEELDRYYMQWGCCKSRAPKCCQYLKFPSILEPQSKLYMCWLALVALCFMYNVWVIPLRGVFPYQTKQNLKYWLAFDYFCDLVYLLDIIIFKPRLTFLNNGIMEEDSRLTRKNYMKKTMFKFDVLSLLPLDLCYLAVGVVPWLRFPRMLKLHTFWEFYERCDQAVRSAHILRIIKTMTYMLFLIHVETCGYYAMSVYEGIGVNRWVYDGNGTAYIRCFYLATKTATSIGNNPQPTNTLEYIFMVVYWVSGVFVFALLIGQIRDIVDAAGRVKSLYNKRMDAALMYVKNLNLPKETQDKVRTWFIYNWQQQKILDEKDLMNTLPKNLRTDLAIHVHFNTLSKVKLFQDCDKTLLFDLVLKLKPILYLPGDYVCRKGEVGKEMYIVSQGQVDVVGGPDNSIVLATLKEGSVFGEISLLALSGGEGNRRTADVICKGFTNLFILSKADFEAAMSEYPEAHKHMKKRAKKLLRQNAKLAKESTESIGSSKAEEIIKMSSHGHSTPKMVHTVMQVLNPESDVMKKLSGKSQDEHVITKVTEINQNSVEKEESQKTLPTDEEVEEFFNEMLTVEITSPTFPYLDQKEKVQADQTIPDQKEKKKLSRDDTVKTEQSEESTDSGVQLIKAVSPTESTSKTLSNKDSKESIMTTEILTTELADIIEETRSWVEQQTFHTQFISDGGYLGEFFEDSITNDPEDEVQGNQSSNKDNDTDLETVESTSKEADNVMKKEITDQQCHTKTEHSDSNNEMKKDIEIDDIMNMDDWEGHAVEPLHNEGHQEKMSNDSTRSKRQSVASVDSSIGNLQVKITDCPTDINIINNIPQRQKEDSSTNSTALQGVPTQNQITCSVEVHREKSVTPTSISELLESGELHKRGSPSSPHELQYLESSV